MFTHGMVESRMREIQLDEEGGTIDSNAFEALVNFAYSGKVTISTSNVRILRNCGKYMVKNCRNK